MCRIARPHTLMFFLLEISGRANSSPYLRARCEMLLIS